MGARRGFWAGAGAALLAVLVAGTLGYADGGYSLPWSGIGYSGGVLAGGGYALTGAAGQPLAGPVGGGGSGSGGYELNSGFLTVDATDTPCSPLTWIAPLSSSAAYDLPVGQTMTIRFSWGDCRQFIHDESVVVEVANPAQPDYPVTTWVYGFDIAIDDAAQEYRVDFSPSLYGLTAGTDLTVRVYMQNDFAGQAQVHLLP